MFFWTHNPINFRFIRRNKALALDISETDEVLKKSDLLLCIGEANNKSHHPSSVDSPSVGAGRLATELHALNND